MNTKDIEELKDEAVNIWAEQDIYQALDYVITTLTQHHQAEVERAVEESYLSHFSYEDWEVGTDDKLRVGDCINLNHQRGYDGYEQNLEGKLVLHHENKVPVILYNIEPETEDEEESGEYGDIQSFFMNGWTFSRIQALTPTKTDKQPNITSDK